jgi:hypothetical protein
MTVGGHYENGHHHGHQQQSAKQAPDDPVRDVRSEKAEHSADPAASLDLSALDDFRELAGRFGDLVESANDRRDHDSLECLAEMANSEVKTTPELAGARPACLRPELPAQPHPARAGPGLPPDPGHMRQSKRSRFLLGGVRELEQPSREPRVSTQSGRPTTTREIELLEREIRIDRVARQRPGPRIVELTKSVASGSAPGDHSVLGCSA